MVVDRVLLWKVVVTCACHASIGACDTENYKQGKFETRGEAFSALVTLEQIALTSKENQCHDFAGFESHY